MDIARRITEAAAFGHKSACIPADAMTVSDLIRLKEQGYQVNVRPDIFEVEIELKNKKPDQVTA